MVGLSAPRVLVVPRWGGTPYDEWYAWLAEAVAGVQVLELPNPDAPNLEAWTHGVFQAIGDDPYALARTLVVGHSAGCRAILHALALLAPGRAVSRVLCVAGWWSLDDPWPQIQPWIDAPIDLEAVKAGQHGIRVLLSTNDPFTADADANAASWRERLDAEVQIAPEAGHFTGPQQPLVLTNTRDLFAQL